jgi:nitroreductase
MMIKDYIDNRWSARHFDNKSIEQDKIDYILHCATHAPSKQCAYTYEIYTVGQDEAGKELKEWLYWDHTWCVEGWRAKPEHKDSTNKKFNPQVRAPLLLIWLQRPLNERDGEPYMHDIQNPETNWSRSSLQDAMVSASFAMLAAEEQGLQTCFTGCFCKKGLAKKIDPDRNEALIMLSIGYATPTEPDPEQIPSAEMEVYDESGKHVGWQQRNWGLNWPIRYHYQRRRTPDRSKLIKKY